MGKKTKSPYKKPITSYYKIGSYKKKRKTKSPYRKPKTLYYEIGSWSKKKE